MLCMSYCNQYLQHSCQYYTYLLTYILNPWIRVLLEKVIGSQLVKKFPAFYENRRFIAAFTRARHPSLSWASPIQSMSLHPTTRRSISILSPICAWVFQVVSFHQDTPPKPCIRLSSLPHVLHAPPISFFSISSAEKYWVRSTDH